MPNDSALNNGVPKGGVAEAGGYGLIAWAFLRALGLIYTAAFASLAVQILGLAGNQGIYPLSEQLQWARTQYGELGWLAYPSVFWLAAGDWAILGVAWAGAALGLLLAAWPWISEVKASPLGVSNAPTPLPRPALQGRLAAVSFASLMRALSWIRRSREWGERVLLVLLYLGYLSLVQAGQVFTNFQWDFLLLEAGFLALFLPGASLMTQTAAVPESGSAGVSPALGCALRILQGTPLIVWLFRWLLFRLRFESGLAKLLSGDPSWRDLTAVGHYLETQPLPHIGAWYAHQLPDWVLRLGTAGTLLVELVLPFLLLMPRPWRLIAAWVTILWQVLIIATSNHNFFNLLTIALCLFLFEDRDLAWLRRILPVGCALRTLGPRAVDEQGHAMRPLLSALTLLAAGILVPLSLIHAAELIWRRPLDPVSGWTVWLNRLHIANRYHVFPEIPKVRLEVQIEVSADGKRWEEVDFRYRPDRLDQPPPWVIPHQPRLDWLIWFVPQHPAFLETLERFVDRLKEGSGPVIRLLARPPLGGEPVRFVQLRLWQYRFTGPEERAATGQWWQRASLGPWIW